MIALAGCESEAEKQLDSSVREVHCSVSAKEVAPPSAGVPANLPLPPGAVLFHVDDRGADGLVMSAVTPAPFKDVLAAMNDGYATAGYAITSGETEEHDAEANWTTTGFRGRWAIRDISSQCQGDTLISVLIGTKS